MTNKKDLITDDEWDAWLKQLVKLLEQHEKVLDAVDFLAQIKQKVDDCSRAYTGMWTLDMLHQAYDMYKDKLPEDFKVDLDSLQSDWNVIMERIREQRKELLGKKCIQFFYENFATAENVVPSKELDSLKATKNEKWMYISKRCFEAGLNNDKDYQDFIGKLMIEMVKY